MIFGYDRTAEPSKLKRTVARAVHLAKKVLPDAVVDKLDRRREKRIIRQKTKGPGTRRLLDMRTESCAVNYDDPVTLTRSNDVTICSAEAAGTASLVPRPTIPEVRITAQVVTPRLRKAIPSTVHVTPLRKVEPPTMATLIVNHTRSRFNPTLELKP